MGQGPQLQQWRLVLSVTRQLRWKRLHPESEQKLVIDHKPRQLPRQHAPQRQERPRARVPPCEVGRPHAHKACAAWEEGEEEGWTVSVLHGTSWAGKQAGRRAALPWQPPAAAHSLTCCPVLRTALQPAVCRHAAVSVGRPDCDVEGCCAVSRGLVLRPQPQTNCRGLAAGVDVGVPSIARRDKRSCFCSRPAGRRRARYVTAVPKHLLGQSPLPGREGLACVRESLCCSAAATHAHNRFSTLTWAEAEVRVRSRPGCRLPSIVQGWACSVDLRKYSSRCCCQRALSGPWLSSQYSPPASSRLRQGWVGGASPGNQCMM